MLTTDIEQLLFTILKTPVTLGIPANPDHGDYATNLAFLLVKQLKKNPQSIATELIETLNQNPELTQRAQCTALNGFINIKLHNPFLIEQLHQDHASFPQQNQKILLEYVSANPTGPLHIGHGRWAAIGSVLETLLRHINADISTEFYINDAGNQIQNLFRTIEAIRAGQPIPEDGYHGAYVEMLAHSENPVQTLLDSQKTILERFRVTFTSWFSEKTLHQNDAIVKAIEQLKPYTYTQDGALWFKSTQFQDEKDRVLIKEDGAYTYFAVDIAYHLNKIERQFTHLINIWGADHHGYVERIKAAIKAISAQPIEFQIIIGQLVSLFRNGEPVRMSKRTGEMITLEEVMDEIGVDATRFFLISKNHDTHLEFDLELAKKQSQENPVYYIQYAHARICSIQKKINPTLPITISTDYQLNAQERALILQILQCHEEIYAAATHCAPYKIALYTIALARGFHAFYEHCPILNAPPAIQNARLFILDKVKSTMQTCFSIMGISAPESM